MIEPKSNESIEDGNTPGIRLWRSTFPQHDKSLKARVQMFWIL